MVNANMASSIITNQLTRLTNQVELVNFLHREKELKNNTFIEIAHLHIFPCDIIFHITDLHYIVTHSTSYLSTGSTD